MTEIGRVELFYEPRIQILSVLPKVTGEPEMSVFESAFLCGLIKEFEPHKIVEVGIAGGGTSAIMMQCVKDLNINTSFYFVDKFEDCYRVKGEKSGFLSLIASKYLDMEKDIHVLLGESLPNRVNEIGDNIDLVLLDTVHKMPGEILDYLVILPYLSKNAIVCLHDIRNNQYGYSRKEECATSVIFGSAVGKRMFNYMTDEVRGSKYPNIGAFCINEETQLNVENLFYLLNMTWNYLPSNKDIGMYLECYRNIYPKKLVEMFENAVNMNKFNLSNITIRDKLKIIIKLLLNRSGWQYKMIQKK